ncbi:MAG TPA: hypothetical protein VFL93_08815 [Longimicrobiaceae bacterium]|jgi:hypothetical protein|nr:hypothetical protein [Longimicrobiaceae bacterium]
MARQRRGSDPIDRRLIDEGQEGRQNVIDAASEGFVEDQESPDSPTHRKRRMVEERGIEDPAHSKGSTRRGPGGRKPGGF